MDKIYYFRNNDDDEEIYSDGSPCKSPNLLPKAGTEDKLGFGEDLAISKKESQDQKSEAQRLKEAHAAAVDSITMVRLRQSTKQELLFNMQRKTYKAGQLIFEAGKIVDRMVIIQSGIVELRVPYDRRATKYVLNKETG